VTPALRNAGPLALLIGLLLPAQAFAQGVQVGVSPAASEVAQQITAADDPARALQQLGPPSAPPAVVEAPAEPVAAPIGTQAPPSWLAPPRTEQPVAQTTNKLSTWALVLSFVALGAAWWFQRFRRQNKLSKHLGNARIRVLASNRVGPKAHAVAIEFGGKVFLLGVTDTQVSRLVKLSHDEIAAHLGQELDDRDAERAALGEQDVPRAQRTLGPQPSRQFQSHLDQSLSQHAGSRGAAEELADQLSDAVKLKGRPATELVDIEGQAAGLAARLKNTVGQTKRTR
jgi:flagellar biogenesis protein FliO